MSKSFGFSNMYNDGDFPDNNLLNNINNSGTLYAQNLPPNVLSDAVNYNPNYISDDELYKRIQQNFLKIKQICNYLTKRHTIWHKII